MHRSLHYRSSICCASVVRVCFNGSTIVITVYDTRGRPYRTEGVAIIVPGLEEFRLFVVNAVDPVGKTIIEDEYLVAEEETGHILRLDRIARSVEEAENIFKTQVAWRTPAVYANAIRRDQQKTAAERRFIESKLRKQRV